VTHPDTIRQRFELLTPRQKQVVSLLVEGLTNADVALRMGVTVHTVKAHRAQAMERMKSSSFANLIGQLQHVEMDAAASGNAARAHVNTKAPSVLVVKQDAQDRLALVEELNKRGFVAEGVADGKGLDATWHRQAVCIVIVEIDLGADQKNGLHIAERLISKQTCGVIILADESSKSADRLKVLKLGADACFIKPVNLDELTATITNLARRLR
jgi:DNA-binding NarL/FixJ family response regulator